MKEKKVLAILIAVIGLFTFATTAIGADEEVNAEALCFDCPKCEPGNVPCYEETTIDLGQGRTTTEKKELNPFDYDGNPTAEGGFGPYGYCEGAGFNKIENPYRNCKLILDICTCPEKCNLLPGEQMGVQMRITTPGVFWADPDMNTVYFDLFSGTPEQFPSSMCAVDSSKLPTLTKMTEVDGQVRDFGEVKYYRTVNDVAMTDGTVSWEMKDEGTPLAGAHTGMVVGNNRVIALESVIDTDYVIQDDDDGKCKIWIDVPAMRIDSTAKKGDAINVEVRLLFQREKSGLCPTCNPPRSCGCTRQVGIVCCETADTTKGCMFFPYVIQNYGGWQAGIGVSALVDELPNEAWCNLTLKDQKGNIATYKKTDMGNSLVWAFVLDQIMDKFDKTLEPGVVSLKIESNYRMDGFSFMLGDMNGSYFGAGALARGCENSCCP
ncbi:hypothetical protein [Desulfonema magnum]|uniref:DUF5666 domain-containing protein n=1 Tax=Desulfonema magnum TaxID=45655 RepID=A0A975BFF6_9BACT|nr:hypothetical protein [Desulfonema magnum]QTA84502.1 Uncharacterized protein dnm_004990 [Desulfonema magnum]